MISVIKLIQSQKEKRENGIENESMSTIFALKILIIKERNGKRGQINCNKV